MPLCKFVFVNLFLGVVSLGQTQPGKLLLQDWRPLSQPSGIKKAPKPRDDRGISV